LISKKKLRFRQWTVAPGEAGLKVDHAQVISAGGNPLPASFEVEPLLVR